MADDLEAPRLVEDLTELRANLATFDRLRRNGTHPEHRAYLGFVQRGHCLLPYRAADGLAFAPSRLIGYVDNSLARHVENDLKDGRDTDPLITRLVGAPYREDDGLEAAYRRFCAAAGVAVHARKRKYWPILDLDLAARRDDDVAAPPFVVGSLYTRRDVARNIGFDYEKGGNWDTGYARIGEAFFIFVNVGISGRTGHDYPNRWDGRRLLWSAKTGTRLGQPEMRTMLSGDNPVHLFWRGDVRAAFTYAGRAIAAEVEDVSPVRVVWDFDATASDKVRSEPVPDSFRRGPPPIAGTRASVYSDGATMVYLLELVGPIASAFPDLAEGLRIVKIGMSNDPARRLADLSSGLPPGCTLGWRIVATRRFATAREAFDRETALLERLRTRNRWLGGEFGALTDEELLDIGSLD